MGEGWGEGQVQLPYESKKFEIVKNSLKIPKKFFSILFSIIKWLPILLQ